MNFLCWSLNNLNSSPTKSVNLHIINGLKVERFTNFSVQASGAGVLQLLDMSLL